MADIRHPPGRGMLTSAGDSRESGWECREELQFSPRKKEAPGGAGLGGVALLCPCPSPVDNPSSIAAEEIGTAADGAEIGVWSTLDFFVFCSI